MKKVIILFLLLSCITTNAQLQRSILGNSLGVSKKSQVIQNMRNKGNKVTIVDVNIIRVDDVNFGGNKWGCVFFRFYKGILYYARFQDSEYDTSRETLDITWKNLRSSLKKKYYLEIITDQDEELRFDDDRTIISADYSYFEGYKGIGLAYYDKKLFLMNIQSNDDEL